MTLYERMDEEEMRLRSKKINGIYILDKLIGAGTYGFVWRAKWPELLPEHIVAIKLEQLDEGKPSLMELEYKLYQILMGNEGIPHVYYFCHAKSPSNTTGSCEMAMEMLGPSLEALFQCCDRQFSLKTSSMIGIQMVQRIETFHKSHHVHQDQKPDNYCIGRGKNKKTLYLIDYGLAKRYVKNGKHIPYIDNKPFVGTSRYCSINAHLGIELSRKDDLEAVGYILVYFLRGALPWQGIKAQNKFQQWERIQQRKLQTPISELCRGFPLELTEFILYTKKLRFDDAPDYGYLSGLLQKILHEKGWACDYYFDWCERGVNSDNFGRHVVQKRQDQQNPFSLVAEANISDTLAALQVDFEF